MTYKQYGNLSPMQVRKIEFDLVAGSTIPKQARKYGVPAATIRRVLQVRAVRRQHRALRDAVLVTT